MDTGADNYVQISRKEVPLRAVTLDYARSVAAAERMVTKSRRLDDVFQALEALEAGASGSTCRNNPRCQRVVGVDGAKSKYVNVGTKSAKFGAGLTTTTAALKQKKNQRF